MNETTDIMIAMVLTGIYTAVLCFAGVAGILSYILEAVSLYSIAKRRGLPKPWLAWFPGLSSWILGRIADDYDGRNGIKRKWRVALLTLTVLAFVGLVLAYVFMFGFMLSMGIINGALSREPSAAEMITLFVVVYGGFFAAAFAAMGLQACNIICLYKVYESTVPQRSLKYMLLSVMVPLAKPICLMRCRKHGYSLEDDEYSDEYAEIAQDTEIFPEPEPETAEEEPVFAEQTQE